jgi:hypothetical protein
LIALPPGAYATGLAETTPLERPARYEARLLAPAGWKTSGELVALQLDAGGRGEIRLPARAPGAADGVRRLVTAEIAIDGRSQGPVSEALVTVSDGPKG